MAAIASFIFGVMGWLIVKFLVEPWKEIADLRRDTQECLILHGNLSKDAPADERTAAATSFRRVGAALVARHLAAYPWVQWFCGSFLNWDVHTAGALLISIANTIQFEGFSVVTVSPTATLIRRCLKLPDPKTAPTIHALTEHAGHAGQPGPIEPD